MPLLRLPLSLFLPRNLYQLRWLAGLIGLGSITRGRGLTISLGWAAMVCAFFLRFLPTVKRRVPRMRTLPT
jgi:hypothetical protein